MRSDNFTTAINLVNEIMKLGGAKRKLLFDNDHSGEAIVVGTTEFLFDSIGQLCDKLRIIRENLKQQ